MKLRLFQALVASLWCMFALVESAAAFIEQQVCLNCTYLPTLQHQALNGLKVNAVERMQTLAAGAFVEQNGQVVIEAEHFDATVARNNGSWVARTNRTGYVGAGAMVAEPNNGAFIPSNYVSTSPELRYTVQFVSSGAYYVWLRGAANSGNDDTVHVGLNGQAVSSAAAMLMPVIANGQWSWTNTVMGNRAATLNIPSPGTYTINVWMREDGLLLDRLLLTKSANAPSGTSPAESPRSTSTATVTRTPTATRTATSVPVTTTRTATRVPATATRTATTCCATSTPTTTATSTSASTSTPVAPTSTSVAPTSAPAMPTSTPNTSDPGLKETFEGAESGWQVARETAGVGSVTRSSAQSGTGSYAARAATNGSSDKALLRAAFSDAAANHQWEERPGTFFWQRASLYVPASSVAKLSGDQYLTLAGLYPSSGGSFGWYLRVKAGGDLYVYGYTRDGAAKEFRAYGTFPTNQWVDVELGLHTQAGPGVKRAFAFLVNGTQYGWFHQGNMQSETYDRAAFGVLSTNDADALEVYVDQWRNATSASLPSGPDTRSTANVQEQNFASTNGAHIQYDWSTWEYNPTLSSQYGLYTPDNRLQAGRNLDRMPDVSNGWAEIEITWTKGAPSRDSGTYGPMIGFRKEINREENLEVIPVRRSNGDMDLVLEAWVGNAVELATWPMPVASVGQLRMPEAGDLLRVRWEQVNNTQLAVRVHYYDASAARWYRNVISGTYTLNAVSDGQNSTVNYFDGHHTASSITIDSPWYGIKRFKLGTLATYQEP